MRHGRAVLLRMLVGAAAAILLPACTSHLCKDKTTNAGIYTGFSSVYKACKHECLNGEKECGCSAQCPCWKAENHPKVGAPPPK